uniref:Gamma-glutamylcyclotransferase family protein n=1 Tax=Davidia involucrata TaxID=16924 RepID=A0A5B7CAP2_DAVIN
MGAEKENRRLIFTYGTLKQGFSNHGLLQDMIATGDAAYIGIYRTVEKLPLVCGPYRVPFLLNFPGSGDRVWGEMYAVSALGLSRMDDLEGTSRGHYERLPVKVQCKVDSDSDAAVTTTCAAEAYYAHGSYAEGLWRRNGERGLSIYSKKEVIGYVKRKDRPQHLTFLDHIRLFISSQSD